jgi:hypothetical protein
VLPDLGENQMWLVNLNWLRGDQEITHIFLWRSLISAFLSSSPTSMEEGQSN